MIDNKDKSKVNIDWVQNDTGFSDYLKDLEDKEQPDACNIDDEDCEACGS